MNWSLEHLSNDSLLDELQSTTEDCCMTTARQLARIGEVARRRLYAERGFHSMKAYCVHVLHLSEDAAAHRIHVARRGWLFPVIFDAIADGRVHLTGMRLLVPFIDEENVQELIDGATHRTVAEIELILAERFPLPEPEDTVEELSKDASRHLCNRSRVRPIAPGRYLVQFTISEADHERLEYALQLMSHRNPKGNLAFLNASALELLIEKLENEKFGATDEPRKVEGSPQGRYVPREVRREVWRRDGGRCTYVSPTGRRCECRWQLEFDHVLEFARGGEATVENLRLVCRAHNQYLAERAFGAGFMEERRGFGPAGRASMGSRNADAPSRLPAAAAPS